MKLRIHQILQQSRQWLSQQGPIGVFIHHNTLHSLEDRPFEEAVELASRVRGTRPYLSHGEYLELWRGGRISDAAIDELLPHDRVSRALLEIDSSGWTDSVVNWLRGEKGWAPNDSLWTAAEDSASPSGLYSEKQTQRTSVDEELTRFLGAFVDRGLSFWPLPDRDKGILAAYRSLAKIYDDTDAYDVVLNVLRQMSIPEREWETFLHRELLALPGWAGIISYFEERPAEKAKASFSLIEYLAVRLLHIASNRSEINSTSPADAPGAPATRLERYLLCEKLGLSPSELDTAEIAKFNDLARRRLLHQAFENTFYQRYLGALATHRGTAPLVPETHVPAFQSLFCIDEREESLRRHLEEVAGEKVETFAIAGFFGVDMFYQGMGEAHEVPLCPAMMTPQTRVTEKPVTEHEVPSFRWRQVRGALQKTARYLHDHSRATLTGMLVCAGTGIVASIPLIARVLFPRQASRLRRIAGDWLHPTVDTRLQIERAVGTPAQQGVFEGYTVDEMESRVSTVLKGIALTSRFSPLVFVIGHGSNSLNNPHESAHDCGACGGRSGAPNGRAYAQMANHPEVRAKLAAKGLVIPPTTHFIGGYHDTCSDALRLFDLDAVPASHLDALRSARECFDEARTRDAHERCRRFDNARHLTPKNALKHVEARCQTLSEPRPEYGHASNAACIVGRRAITRNLFLDRRTFLSSYDAQEDPDGSILAGILGAVIPVCAGISLEYYFSFVDNEGYGCGTKLPHNITGLIGVMNGSGSDLRTGLPWQMVEIHEPMRLLFVIEAPPAHLDKLMKANAGIRRLVQNRWVVLVLMDYDTGELTIYQGGKFAPYPTQRGIPAEFSVSSAYYSRKAIHLAPVKISRNPEVGHA